MQQGLVGTCIRGAKPMTDDVLFQTTFLPALGSAQATDRSGS